MSKEKYYYIDFRGYCKIKATSREEAEKFFWHRIDQMENTSAEIELVELFEDVFDSIEIK